MLFQQTKSWWGMKIWKFTLRRSSGVKNTLRQSQSLQSFFPENLWENDTLQLKAGDRQCGSTTNNIDILTLDVCLPPRIFISFAMISNNQLFQNFTRIPRLSSPISTRNCLLGHMEVDRNGKMISGRTYNWHSICLDEVISSGRITLFSDILWNSNTWLSIDGFTGLNN